MISIKLQCNFTEMTLLRQCSPVNLLQIFRTPLNKNRQEGMLLLVTPSHTCIKKLGYWSNYPHH